MNTVQIRRQDDMAKLNLLSFQSHDVVVYQKAK